MKFISVSAMRSKLVPLIGLALWLVGVPCTAGVVLERVMALVGESPVYYSEFLEFRMTLKEAGRYRSDAQVLEELVNRRLLKLEAMRLHLDTGVSDEQALIDRYLELAVRGSLTRSRRSHEVLPEESPEGLTREPNFGDDSVKAEQGQESPPEYETALERKLKELRERYGVRINPAR